MDEWRGEWKGGEYLRTWKGGKDVRMDDREEGRRVPEDLRGREGRKDEGTGRKD